MGIGLVRDSSVARPVDQLWRSERAPSPSEDILKSGMHTLAVCTTPSQLDCSVALAFQQSGIDQGIEPARQHVGGDAEAFLELIEPPQAMKSVPQDEDAPPFAYPLQAAGDRARHAVEVFALHWRNMG